MADPNMGLRTLGRKILHRTEPKHNDGRISFVIRKDMRPTVLAETPPLAWGGLVSFKAHLARGQCEPCSGDQGTGAEDGAMNLPTGPAVAMFKAVDLALDLEADHSTMTTSCEHQASLVGRYH